MVFIVDLYFKETGKTNQETIIFLHGECMSGWMWDWQLEAFKDYHCIVPDLPGHGMSNMMEPFAVITASKIISELVQTHAHNGKAHFVGISLGAQIVLQILATAPESVDHVFISGTLVCNKPKKQTMLKLLDYITKVYEPIKSTDFMIKANMRTYNLPKTLFSNFKESTRHIGPDSLTRILIENISFKPPANLDKVEIPTLIMAGEKDYEIIRESMYYLMKILPNSEAAVALKYGHLWNLESPKLFNTVLRMWLKESTIHENGISRL